MFTELRNIVDTYNPVLTLISVGVAFAGVVWLAAAGEWKILGVGLVCMFVASPIIAICLAPTLLLTRFVRSTDDPPQSLRIIVLGTVSTVYAATIMAGWAFAAFHVFTFGNVLDYVGAPSALAAHTVATAPWHYVREKEERIAGYPVLQARTLTFFLGFGCALLGWNTISDVGSAASAARVYVFGVMGVGAAVHVLSIRLGDRR